MSAPDAPPPALPARLAQQDEALLQHLWHNGLPLCDEPFAELGRGLGLGGDTVIERLRLLLGRGVIVCICPIFASAPPSHAHAADDALDGALRAALVSGLPLVKQPYEAMGAMLGCSAERVRQQLADWRDSGRMLRIAALPPPQPQLAG
jgi:DNA-binding Lrp family transcriptional regulator